MLQTVTSEHFYDFLEKLKSCRISYLSMMAGTLKAAREQSDWLETYDDQYIWLVDDLGDRQWCLYVLKKTPPALWLSAVLPSDWTNRFDILDASFPRLVNWFMAKEHDQELYGQIGGPNAPMTLLESFLPIFLKARYETGIFDVDGPRRHSTRPRSHDLPEGFYNGTVSGTWLGRIGHAGIGCLSADGRGFFRRGCPLRTP